jgi:hypothetical protein
MLFMNVITVYSENNWKYIYTLCGQNSEFYNAKIGGIYNNNCLEGLTNWITINW